MSLTYANGEPVKKGDRIRYMGEPGYVEFVADATDPDTTWYVEQFGGGCMIVAETFGSVFIDTGQLAHADLEFVARASEDAGRMS